MNKLTLLVLLIPTACATQEQNAQWRQEKLARAESACAKMGASPTSQDYVPCLNKGVQPNGLIVWRDWSNGPLIVEPIDSSSNGQPRRSTVGM
jgi:hypothetical protein